MSVAVSVRGLTRKFGRNHVLNGVDIDVPAGSITALLGRNGAGKSTLLKILVGFLPPSGGEVRVLGLDPAKKGPRVRRLVGYVPDRTELPRWMTVRDHFRFLEAFYPSWDRTQESRLVQVLGLERAAKVRDLSKGQRAKHALVAALAHRPELLLLDEPFSGLDPIVRHEVLGAVVGHLRDDGRTVVLVSHSMADVERAADRVVLLENGRVRLEGDLEEVRRRAQRVAVTLRGGADAVWTAPGEPGVQRDGAELVLTYLDWDERHEALLRADSAVESFRRLPRALDDVFLAAVGKEEAPCAAS